MDAEELRLAIVALEQTNEDQTQDDEDARRRLQGYMEVFVSTADTRDAISKWSSCLLHSPGPTLCSQEAQPTQVICHVLD